MSQTGAMIRRPARRLVAQGGRLIALALVAGLVQWALCGTATAAAPHRSAHRAATRAAAPSASAAALAEAAADAEAALDARQANAARAASASRPPLAVTGAALIDADTGQLLFGVNPNTERAIASTTKLMTALITMQHVRRLGRIFTQNNWRPAAADSQIGLSPGERMSVHDLVLAMMLPSADDAAEDLAYNVGGHSVGRFVSMMNAEARALHLRRTHYSTPSGLDTPGNYSTPVDLVRLAAYDMSHWRFLRWVVRQGSAELLTGNYRRHVTNLNDLVRNVSWINGVKTGHTADAGYVLVASGTRGGMNLIGSVLGTSSEAARDENALTLLEWGYAHFREARPVRAGQVLARPAQDGSSQHAIVVAGHPLKLAVLRTDRVRVIVHVPPQLTGPLARHAVVGEADVFVGRHRVARIPLVLARPVPAVAPVTKAARFLFRPTTLLWLMLAAGGVFAYSAARRRRHSLSPRGPVEERSMDLDSDLQS